jgi:hypothetical protein
MLKKFLISSSDSGDEGPACALRIDASIVVICPSPILPSRPSRPTFFLAPFKPPLPFPLHNHSPKPYAHLNSAIICTPHAIWRAFRSTQELGGSWEGKSWCASNKTEAPWALSLPTRHAFVFTRSVWSDRPPGYPPGDTIGCLLRPWLDVHQI